MKKIIISIITIFLIAGCSIDLLNDSREKPLEPAYANNQMGTLQILLTDAPAVYDSVVITFAEISANIDSEWVTISVDTMRVNILEWNNGNTMVLGTNQVPAGYYSQIRLKIIDAEIGVDGQVFPMKVPSGAQSGLKLGPGFTVVEGATYQLIVDFDANRSIVTTGPPHNPKGYKLKPRIRVIPQALSGSIYGQVQNYADFPVAYAISGGDTVTSSIIDTFTGNFRLSFLPENYYTVSIQDTAGFSFQADSIYVQPGNEFDLGNITLQ